MLIGSVPNVDINLRHEMKKDELWIKAMAIGSRMGCHQRADRSFCIKDYQFPICARCTGIVFSTVIGYLIFSIKRVGLICGFILCIPMMIDGSIQYFGVKESTNLRRFLTGFLGGIGFSIVRLNIYSKAIRMIRKLLKLK